MSLFPNDQFGSIAFGLWNETVDSSTEKEAELEELELQRDSMSEAEYQRREAEIEENY